MTRMRLDPRDSRSSDVAPSCALYCAYYLEVFILPFVHPPLRQAPFVNSSRTDLFEYVNVEIGVGKEGEPCFDLPAGHPDAGQRIAAYYFWVFPNLMLNFYPWGLSINLVRPIAVDRCRVLFESYVLDPSKRA